LQDTSPHQNARSHLLALRNSQGWWEGELSSSALSTATACVALHLVDPGAHAAVIHQGRGWLLASQNADGGWGDTPSSRSNLSTTLLVWSALGLLGLANPRAEAWIVSQVGSLEPNAICRAVIARYGRDKTFSVPILMMAAVCGRLGPDGWRQVLPLPFELAALPRSWFGALGLPVVSYALPALIAIGHARFHHRPPSWLNPLRWLRWLTWRRVGPMLRSLQPSTGGYLEATPLTSFVTMALASAGQAGHPCVPEAVRFLKASMRPDGSWPIDTNLATWGTTLAVKALGPDFDSAPAVHSWLLSQQWTQTHPFTNAAPGGWAWTDLPGGVPDADDTSGALVALAILGKEHALPPSAPMAGITWLLDLQNRDGGMPTFCRGWGALPFDRSTPELTAHALWAWSLWEAHMPRPTQQRIQKARRRALAYLEKCRHLNQWCWEPLWFGNEHAVGEINLVYGTAMVLHYLKEAGIQHEMVAGAEQWLISAQNLDGSWGAKGSIEETAVSITALGKGHPEVTKARTWLVTATKGGTDFPRSPIGLYFARLWYHERLYPVVWATEALR
jgi:squalene-hopene/tetraprenyl-beta-curcumene cyclase